MRRRLPFAFSTAGWIAVAFAIVVLLGSLAVFAGATEDVTQHNGMATHDAANLRHFINARTGLTVDLAKFGSEIGAVAVIGLLALLGAALLWWRGMRLGLALAPLAAFVCAAGAVAVIKFLVDRSRPPVALHLVQESDASFPSGHATDSAAVFMTFAFVVA